jgi:hypothetical protein
MLVHRMKQLSMIYQAWKVSLKLLLIFNAFLQDTSLLLLVTRDIALLSLQQDGKFISQNLLRWKRMGVIKHVSLIPFGLFSGKDWRRERNRRRETTCSNQDLKTHLQEKQQEERSNEPFGTLRDVKYHTLPWYFECTKTAKTNLSDKILIEKEWISDDFSVLKHYHWQFLNRELRSWKVRVVLEEEEIWQDFSWRACNSTLPITVNLKTMFFTFYFWTNTLSNMVVRASHKIGQ